MPRASHSRGTTSGPVLWRLRPVFGLPGLLALRLEGEVDLAACLPVETDLLSRLDRVGWGVDVVLDVRDVTVLSATGMAVLTRLADRLATGGRRLLVVAGRGMAGRLLRAAHAGDVLEIFPSFDTALSSLSCTLRARESAGPDGAGDGVELDRLRSQVRDLRDKLSTRPLVAHALGMLQERYGLPDMAAASALLNQSSQRYNVRMRELAAAFVVARPPCSPAAALWFPGRVRSPEPRVTFAPVSRGGRAALLDLLLDAAVTGTSAAGGVVRVFDAARGDLVVERRRGLPRLLAEKPRGSAAWPVALDRTVIVDVGDGRYFTEGVREVLLDAGVRVVVCTPLAARADRPLGIVSTLHTDSAPCCADVRLLERVGAEAGTWLAWHTRTVTLDALEYLHRIARTGEKS